MSAMSARPVGSGAGGGRGAAGAETARRSSPGSAINWSQSVGRSPAGTARVAEPTSRAGPSGTRAVSVPACPGPPGPPPGLNN